jgi:drug/metabolite transporter (DMT)-like permease
VLEPSVAQFFDNRTCVARDSLKALQSSIAAHCDFRVSMNVRRATVVGILAGFTSALIGAAWQIATRFGVTTSLLPSDLALLRYAIPALLLSPLLFKHGFRPAKAHRGWLALLVCCGGFVYGGLAMTGALYSPAAHMGVLISGTMPMFTALLLFAVAREPIPARRVFGYGLILLGALWFGFASSRITVNDAWIGDLFFICASIIWAIYTLAFRKLALSPWYATALVCFWSSIAALLWVIVQGRSLLLAAPVAELMLQIALQGIVAGLLGSFVYAVSIRHLGANNAAVFGAFVPLLSAVGGYLLLAESITVFASIALAIVVIGILFANDRRSR